MTGNIYVADFLFIWNEFGHCIPLSLLQKISWNSLAFHYMIMTATLRLHLFFFVHFITLPLILRCVTSRLHYHFLQNFKCIGNSKPVVWGTRDLHPGFPWFSSSPWFPWFFANPALNSLFVAVWVVFVVFVVCVISVVFVKGDPHQVWQIIGVEIPDILTKSHRVLQGEAQRGDTRFMQQEEPFLP